MRRQLQTLKGVAQPAGMDRRPAPTSAGVRKLPAAPPVYAPIARKVLQAKPAGPAKTLKVTAPPVYRPQPAPRVLQTKPRPGLNSTPPSPRIAPRVTPVSTRPVHGPHVIQTMLRTRSGSGGGSKEGGDGLKRAKVEQPRVEELTLRDHIAAIFRLILERLDARNSRVLPLRILVTTKISDMIAEQNTDSKRNWQYLSVGTLSMGPPALVETSNNMQDLERGDVEERLGSGGGDGRVRSLQRDGPIKIRGRQFHAETSLVAHGCENVGVSGGKNCIFCSLYFYIKDRPFSYHTEGIKSWHLPEPKSIAEFFGGPVAGYITQHGDDILAFRNCPVATLRNAQDLIDLLCATTVFWRG